MDLSELLALGVAALSIASIGSVGYLRGTVTNLRGQLGDADRENNRLTEKTTRLEAELVVAKGDILTLQRMKSGEDYWARIETTLEGHHTKAEEHWRNQDRQMEALIGEVHGLRGDA